jgi:hypothetical protein
VVLPERRHRLPPRRRRRRPALRQAHPLRVEQSLSKFWGELNLLLIRSSLWIRSSENQFMIGSRPQLVEYMYTFCYD